MVFEKVLECDLENIVNSIKAEYGIFNNFFLNGDLGAGKTTFVRKFCELLGVEEVVSSPSFPILNSYEFNLGMIYHADVYRLLDEEEVFEAGVEEILSLKAVKFLEWMEKFPHLMKNGYILNFSINEDFSRKIEVKKV